MEGSIGDTIRWRLCRSLSLKTRRDVPASPVTRPLPRDVSTRRRDAVETLDVVALPVAVSSRHHRCSLALADLAIFLTLVVKPLEEIAGRSSATRSPHTVVVPFGYYASGSSRRTCDAICPRCLFFTEPL
ncbi:Os11g0305800 [Oryza sativa Japonica Group]|uniref:Os11g0305800 protein n=1 Tax=Oryza sativa subsp. japonica TaxID=39947 RepID=A0A0P0Y1A1_ORYSJ|nr:Os11g0305800 [Oryza sativa Japonica Group]